MTENKAIHEFFFHFSTTRIDPVSLLFIKFCLKMLLHHMCAGERGVRVGKRRVQTGWFRLWRQWVLSKRERNP